MAPTLSEDEIDDLLYFARVGEKGEFDALKEELCKREKVDVVELVRSARDSESGNGILHMAAANGHHSEWIMFLRVRGVMGLSGCCTMGRESAGREDWQ